jgi:hypothetical protein
MIKIRTPGARGNFIFAIYSIPAVRLSQAHVQLIGYGLPVSEIEVAVA